AMWTGGAFDFDGDVDIFDFGSFQGNYGTVAAGYPVEVDTVVMPDPPFGGEVPPYLLSNDLNKDHVFDMFDFLIFQRNFGNTEGMMPTDGDLDHDGDVDIFDWAIFDYCPSMPAPEPATALLLALGAAAVFGKIRRR
ncbi:MAG: PEP-CTERM sorting domain-containing protein, partial [Planctomycetes bacterium]|nr:PEP-CTERM sorting domain-containing protein [Planctomycetota bacterium]